MEVNHPSSVTTVRDVNPLLGLYNRVSLVPVGSDRKGHPGELLGHRPQALADRNVV
jgi:hypothetical protein